MKKTLNIIMIVVFSILNTIFLPWNIHILLEQIEYRFTHTDIEMAILYPILILFLSIIPLILNTLLMIFSKGLKIKLTNLMLTLTYILQLIIFFGIIFIISLN